MSMDVSYERSQDQDGRQSKRAASAGALDLFEAMADAGADVCFANPGTTEMPMVKALEQCTRIRPVLGLFEGVCTGAADGFARMTDRPALTMLHLGPGLANGLANLHNARRALSPIVNIVGDHASWHIPFDAPLTSDIKTLAAPMSNWLTRRSTRSCFMLARRFSPSSVSVLSGRTGSPGLKGDG